MLSRMVLVRFLMVLLIFTMMPLLKVMPAMQPVPMPAPVLVVPPLPTHAMVLMDQAVIWREGTLL